MKNIFNLGIKTVLYSKYNSMSVKMERWNSQLEHGQPMEQTRGLFCMCDEDVARCQSQHRYHFWRMSSMVKAIAGASELGSCQSKYV